MNQVTRIKTAAMPPPAAPEFMAESYAGVGVTLDQFAARHRGQTIVELGTGRSIDLGIEVARRVPVKWINAHVQYGDPKVLTPLQQRVAEIEHELIGNVLFAAGDIGVRPGASGASWNDLYGNVDVTYGWNMVNHYLRIQPPVRARHLGIRIVSNMLQLPNPDGFVVLGPTHGIVPDDLKHGARSLRLNKYPSVSDVRGALEALAVHGRIRRRFYAAMDSGVSLYKASQFKPGRKGHVMYRHGDNEPVPLRSGEGIKLAAQLSCYMIKPKKFEPVT